MTGNPVSSRRGRDLDRERRRRDREIEARKETENTRERARSAYKSLPSIPREEYLPSFLPSKRGTRCPLLDPITRISYRFLCNYRIVFTCIVQGSQAVQVLAYLIISFSGSFIFN